jgi:membrane protein DedA with SNARE-associated domain
LFDLIIFWLTTYGGWGVALLMFLENVFPPIPSELVMPFAGYLAADGTLSFSIVVLAGTIGSVAGAYLWYLVGVLLGEQRLRRLVEKHGKWLTLNNSDLEQALLWFQRHGAVAVFLGRMIPGIRTFISIPAGLTGMPVWLFICYTTFGSIIWTMALAAAGFFLKAQFDRVEAWLNPVTNVLLIGLAIVYLWRLLKTTPAE